MRFWVVTVRSWYLVFVSAVFVVLAVVSDVIPTAGPLIVQTQQEKKTTPIFQGNAAKPNVALACNVFWGEDLLPDMLRILNEKKVKVTFFIGGSWAKRNPDCLRQLAQSGHEIANHSYSHPHPNKLSKQQNQQEITRTEELVKEVTGKKTTLYAPPYGEYNDTVLAAADELGYKTIMWTIDTIDWQRPAPATIIQRVTGKLKNGAIILMHPTEPTQKALGQLIDEIRRKGYELATVSDIITTP